MYSVSLDTNSIRKLLEDFYKITGIRSAFVSYDLKKWMHLKSRSAYLHQNIELS